MAVDNERYADLKEDFKETKQDFKETKHDVKKLAESITLIEKSIITSEAIQKSILVILTANKITLDDNARRLTVTENLTLNLKNATQNIKITTNELTKEVESNDIKYIARMDAMSEEIKIIKELPYKNYIRVKWIFYTTMISGVGVIFTLLWEKVFKGFFK